MLRSDVDHDAPQRPRGTPPYVGPAHGAGR